MAFRPCEVCPGSACIDEAAEDDGLDAEGVKRCLEASNLRGCKILVRAVLGRYQTWDQHLPKGGAAAGAARAIAPPSCATTPLPRIIELPSSSLDRSPDGHSSSCNQALVSAKSLSNPSVVHLPPQPLRSRHSALDTRHLALDLQC